MVRSGTIRAPARGITSRCGVRTASGPDVQVHQALANLGLMQQFGWRLTVKRTIDLTVAGSGLLVLSPLLVASALGVFVTMGRPVLFWQLRPGKHGRPFRICKLRTMRSGSGDDQDRLTPLGRLLRAASIDEVPQLWNVLRGEMSLVGPRPLLMHYLARYDAHQARRHEVMPGITGWAQINGRNALTHEQRFELDVWYVDHWSLWLDGQILLRTCARLFERRGISANGHATMPEFLG